MSTQLLLKFNCYHIAGNYQGILGAWVSVYIIFYGLYCNFREWRATVTKLDDIIKGKLLRLGTDP